MAARRLCWRVGPWVPIGAVQTASGYEVAWKVTGTDQYTVWNIDSNGNYCVSNSSGVCLGTAQRSKFAETTFNQDLNGDGAIGYLPPAIETLVRPALCRWG